MIELSKIIEIPPPLRLTTGGEEEVEIERSVAEFFTSVREGLGLAAARADSMFRAYNYQQNYSDHHPTDDRVHLLTFRDREPLAHALDWRDDSNFHVVKFGVYSISPMGQHAIEQAAVALNEFEQSRPE